MFPVRSGAGCALVTVLGLLVPNPAPAQVIDILKSFTGGVADGEIPGGSLTVAGRSLFGLTNGGGDPGNGTAFSINLDSTNFRLLHSFANTPNNGADPFGTLAFSGSAFYGMTLGGGSTLSDGTVFRIQPDGTGFGFVHVFTGGATDGSTALGSPALSGSTLYGVTMQGGTANLGTVFKVNVDGTGFGLLHSFTGSAGDGQAPGQSAPLVSGSALYGVTAEGGSAGLGTLFRVSTDGTGFSVLHSFVASTGDGWDPIGSLVSSGSTLYGMTYQGGGGTGAIYAINIDGSGYARLHTFAGGSSDGSHPLGDLLIAGSEMYGMTSTGGADNLGVIFQMGLDGTGYEVLHSFTGGPNDGASPAGGLILIGNELYGMTVQGGSSNDGVIFSYPVPEPSSLALLLSFAKPSDRGDWLW